MPPIRIPVVREGDKARKKIFLETYTNGCAGCRLFSLKKKLMSQD